MNLKGVNIAVISRSTGQSPNLSSADDKIIRAVLQKLRNRCLSADLYTEEEFISLPVTQDVVVNMCRLEKSLAKLQCLEDDGVLVINSGYAIKSCTRRRLAELFKQYNIPAPLSAVVKTDSSEMPFGGEFYPCWLKLPDNPTVIREDIAFAKTPQEYKRALDAYAQRGVKEVFVSRHLHGDLVKFYSVSGSGFLHTMYPTLSGHSKFGYEENNDPVKSIPFSCERLSQICRVASEVTGISVFGGDCIIAADGEPYIIDFNDWPSFSGCVEEGSDSIVELIMDKIKER